MRALTALLAAAALSAPFAAEARARITIVNVNAPGVGFNDPTPAAPLPTNPGTTVGQQRLIAFQHAADLWGKELDSKVEIRVQARFTPLSCTPTAAVLGSAGPIQVFSDFPGARFPGTWYHVALANKLAREDLAPGDPGTDGDDIGANFNSELGTPACLAGLSWYYGRDTNEAPNQINLVVVLLHEFAHGLGFSSFTSVSTGRMLGFLDDAGNVVRLPSVYDKFYFDLTTRKFREQMTDAERVASAINARNVAWVGAEVTDEVPEVLQRGTPLLTVRAPAAVAGSYQVGTASFGPALTAAGVTGKVVLGLDPADAAGPSTTDGCSPFTNAAEVAGNIALVDRGTCGFVVKAANAQAAGATALIVADNQPGRPPPGLGGADPTITIPAVRITRADGVTLKAELANGVIANLGLDLRVRAGASPQGFALLNAPDPVQPGSSISHWDPIATPNQLMEPAINADLTFSVDEPQDLTLSLFRDIGWHEGRGRKKN
jgi:hypothetical protein